MARGDALVRVADLAREGLIAAEAADGLEQVVERFQLRLTRTMAERIAEGPADGPVARQFVPGTAELDLGPGERADPIGDEAFSPLKGLTHRYADRVLLKPTHLCQVYCRFCFRREKVGHGEENLDEAEIAAALDYVRARPEIFEVILTGGDPLVLSDRRLGAIMDALAAIPHVAVVRLHSRAPVVDPERITPGIVAALRRRFATWIVVHTNHADEIGDAARAALGRLVDGGIPLLAQTVLLKGVNDDAASLEALFRALVAARVKPYYLHHLDLAEGTGQFRTSIEEGRALMRDLRGRVTGIAQPTYVLDIPGGHGKVPIGPDYLRATADGAYAVEDPNGVVHDYVDPAATAASGRNEEEGER